MVATLLVSLLFISHAHAERLLERLCFNSSDEAASAMAVINTILIKPADEIVPEGACLNVFVEEKRGDLFERWVQTRLPHAQSTFSTRNAPFIGCDMEFIKRTKKDQVVSILDSRGRIIGARAGESIVMNEETSILKMASGKSAGINAGEYAIDITCTRKANDRFNVQFELKSVPQSLPNVYNPSQPLQLPRENAVGLKTEVETGVGQEINVGQIVKDLTKDDQSVELPPGFTKTQTVGAEHVDFILKMK